MSAALTIGQSAQTQRRFTPADAAELHTLTGAPPETARVPEPLINGLFSYLLGVELPGQGTNYLKQETRFLADAPFGEPLIARVEITRLRPDKQLVDLATTCTTSGGVKIAEGRALVLAKDVAGAFNTPV
ncbi:phosphate acetyltransferase [Maricaulis sp. W15]|uniref:phosphate acetyltransferase n=1 Tax=Maricaulis sp. W15 TaxID=1772333 RepID=UPI000948D495|nr:phosphate acetyltransferase [Maricaulis sp. W15]OLF81152.1 phosphate acetyltransferase [Maricaulis sp. W15]